MTGFDEVQSKIKNLCDYILNPEKIPDRFTAKECNDMAFLNMEVDSAIKEFNHSDKSQNDLNILSSKVDDIESRAKNI